MLLRFVFTGKLDKGISWVSLRGIVVFGRVALEHPTQDRNDYDHHPDGRRDDFGKFWFHDVGSFNYITTL